MFDDDFFVLSVRISFKYYILILFSKSISFFFVHIYVYKISKFFLVIGSSQHRMSLNFVLHLFNTHTIMFFEHSAKIVTVVTIIKYTVRFNLILISVICNPLTYVFLFVYEVQPSSAYI